MLSRFGKTMIDIWIVPQPPNFICWKPCVIVAQIFTSNSFKLSKNKKIKKPRKKKHFSTSFSLNAYFLFPLVHLNHENSLPNGWRATNKRIYLSAVADRDHGLILIVNTALGRKKQFRQICNWNTCHKWNAIYYGEIGKQP